MIVLPEFGRVLSKFERFDFWPSLILAVGFLTQDRVTVIGALEKNHESHAIVDVWNATLVIPKELAEDWKVDNLKPLS